jgi:hypothetical protein
VFTLLISIKNEAVSKMQSRFCLLIKYIRILIKDKAGNTNSVAIKNV